MAVRKTQMGYENFVHLRAHSSYSLSQGAMRVGDIVQKTCDMRMPAVGIADNGNLFGAMEFSQAATQKGIQPLIACQVTLASKPKNEWVPMGSIVLLAMNARGLLNLQFISSEGFRHSDPAAPVVGIPTVLKHSEGLFCLSGGMRGPLFNFLEEGLWDEANDWLSQFNEAFKGYFAIELQRYGYGREKHIEPGLMTLANDFSLPLVATNEIFFSTPQMYEADDALLCIGQRCTLDVQERFRVTPQHYFKSPQEMRELFSDVLDACDNTVEIAKLCSVKVEKKKPLLPVSPKVPQGKSEEEVLRSMAREGLAARLNVKTYSDITQKNYTERLEHELDIISKMGFPGYFMIVADFIQWAKEHNIPVGPGRGSGAGSLVAWALTITEIDPLKFNLLFERFLNPERVSMPDFDIDFCQDRRDEVIDYVRSEYGEEKVAQIITFGKLQARAAVRDIGRVLGQPYGKINKLAELIPNNPAHPVSLKQALEHEPDLRRMCKSDEALGRVMAISQKIEGLFRHAGTHAAGVVIGDRPLVELVPLYRDPKSEMLVTQYNMKCVEQAGLVKFDFLGLTTLTVINRGLQFLKEMGKEVDITQIPLDDKKTYQMLGRGDTAGVFQFEGAGMQDALRQMQPERMEDLIAAVALYRPGPMENIPKYCRRKHGESWEPPHEMVRDIVGETYGIMVYQEQVMQIAQKMAGYSLGEADLLRRAMGKKIHSEMEHQRSIFVKGAIKKGVSAEKAEEVFDLMARFADYGFNKSHAAAYAFVAYQTAWMKANYPVAFLAGSMSLAREKTEKLQSFVHEAKRLGIDILPPDINRAKADFSVEKDQQGHYAIRYALSAVKGVGLAAMQHIEDMRKNHSFQSMADFAKRSAGNGINRRQIENLAKAGAFDHLYDNRKTLVKNAEKIIRFSHSHSRDAQSGQIGLFGQQEDVVNNLPFDEVKDWSKSQRLATEAEVIGFYLTAHPMNFFSKNLSKMGVKPLNVCEHPVAGSSTVRVAGVVIELKEHVTKKGSRMAWLKISDETSEQEITVFSEVLSQSRDILQEGKPVIVDVDMRKDGQKPVRLTASKIRSIDDMLDSLEGGMDIWYRDISSLEPLRAVLGENEGGKGKVRLFAEISQTCQAQIKLDKNYRLHPEMKEQILHIPGIHKVVQS